jgi:hypothetical protein
MRPAATGLVHHTASNELNGLAASWARHLRAQRSSPAYHRLLRHLRRSVGRIPGSGRHANVADVDRARARRSLHDRP